MKCDDVQPLLPLHAYGDLDEAQRAAVAAHLDHCATCRAEADAFASIRRQLGETNSRGIAVDLAGIYRMEADRIRRRAQWWKRGMWAAVAAATLLLLSRCDVTVNEDRLTLRWGKPEATPVREHIVRVESRPGEDPRVTDQVQILREMVHALAALIASDSSDRQSQIDALKTELARLQKRTETQYAETRHDVSALYTAQFGSTRKENIP
jgi:anti-sigma factor RsiW